MSSGACRSYLGTKSGVLLPPFASRQAPGNGTRLGVAVRSSANARLGSHLAHREKRASVAWPAGPHLPVGRYHRGPHE
jgi:hypothetical protein